MSGITIKVNKNDNKLWIGIINDKVVLRNKDFDTLVSKLKKQFPNDMPCIVSLPICATLV